MQKKISHPTRVTPHISDEWVEIVECCRLGRIYTASLIANDIYITIPLMIDLSSLPVFFVTQELSKSLSQNDWEIAVNTLSDEHQRGVIKLPDLPFVLVRDKIKGIRGADGPIRFWLFEPNEDAIVCIRGLQLIARNVCHLAWMQVLIRPSGAHFLDGDALRFIGLSEVEQYAILDRFVNEWKTIIGEPSFVDCAFEFLVFANMIKHAPTGDWVYADRGPHSDRVAKRRNEEKLAPIAPVRVIKTIHLLQPPPRLITPQEPSSPKRQNQRKTRVWSVEEHQRRRPKSGGFATVPAHLRGPGRDTETPPPQWYLVRP